jgi:hypothetical protein
LIKDHIQIFSSETAKPNLAGKTIFNSIFEKNTVLVEENLIIGVYEGEINEDLLLMNLHICTK